MFAASSTLAEVARFGAGLHATPRLVGDNERVAHLSTAGEVEASTDVLVVGAGPAGSAAAAWAARHGLDVVLADKASFPRDKACGDGLTPRAIAELRHLGLGEWLRGNAERGSGTED